MPVKKSKNLLQRLIFIIVLLFFVYLIEGACFRLIDDYANWRLYLALGHPSNPDENKFLKKLSLDHFSECPTDRTKPNHLGYWVGEEADYSTKTLSFTRPLRDNYKDFINYNLNPLGNYKITDYAKAGITDLLLPNLHKFATVNDVNEQIARRVGDQIETVKAVFIKVIVKRDSYTKENEFKGLNSSFGFLAKQGFGCLVLPVSSAEELVDKIVRFKKSETELGANLFAWGEGEAATFLMKSCRLNPNLWNGLFLSTAEQYISPPTSSNLPWVFFEISETRKFEEDRLSIIHEWIESARLRKNIFAKRFSGFVKFTDSERLGKSVPSMFISYLINVENFMNELGVRPKQMGESFLVASDPDYENGNDIVPSSFDLKNIEKNIDEIELTPVTPNFDCEIVREYRDMNAGNSKLLRVSNRDIILKLGLKFEQMGEDVLEQIRLRDPLFFRYYNSLLAIEESPLN
jgi:hypothetical protein